MVWLISLSLPSWPTKCLLFVCQTSPPHCPKLQITERCFELFFSLLPSEAVFFILIIHCKVWSTGSSKFILKKSISCNKSNYVTCLVTIEVFLTHSLWGWLDILKLFKVFTIHQIIGQNLETNHGLILVISY